MSDMDLSRCTALDVDGKYGQCQREDGHPGWHTVVFTKRCIAWLGDKPTPGLDDEMVESMAAYVAAKTGRWASA